MSIAPLYAPPKIRKAHEALELTPPGWTMTESKNGRLSPHTISRDEIQAAYRAAARMYHPDSQHPQRCPIRFRECHEARDVLLRYYATRGTQQRRYRDPSDEYGSHHQYSSSRAQSRRQSTSTATSTARTFNWRRKFAVRAVIMTVLTIGSVYKDYYYMPKRRREMEQY